MSGSVGRSPELKRELGLSEAVVYGVGLILGAGIYAILGEATGVTGDSVVISFLLAAAIAALTGLSYAELSSMYPEEEGDYLYVREAFQTVFLPELTALFRLLMGVISSAAVALAFAGYLSVFIPFSPVITAMGLVVVMVFVNYWGIDLSIKLNVVFTAIEVLGLLIIVWLGAGSWGGVDLTHTAAGISGLVEASFLIFFAYLGFSSIVNVSEETEDASSTIPRAIVLSIVITTVLYVAVSLSAVGLVDWAALGRSTSPLADVALVGWGPVGATVVGAIALFSTTNTVLILQVSTSRLLYGVSKAEYGAFPPLFSRVHRDRRTPHYAVALVGVLTLPFVLVGDVGAVAGLANVMLLLVFILVNAALLRLRFTRPDAQRGFRTPLNLGHVSMTAVLGLVSCLVLLGFFVSNL